MHDDERKPVYPRNPAELEALFGSGSRLTPEYEAARDMPDDEALARLEAIAKRLEERPAVRQYFDSLLDAETREHFAALRRTKE